MPTDRILNRVLDGSIFDVSPHEEEIPIFRAPTTQDETNRLEQLRSELVAHHRHADTLLNNRLQGFIVGTSLLVGGYSQFREPRYATIAFILAVCGLALAATILHVLHRTARAIEWYITAVKAIEAVLYEPDFRPYSTRHQRQKQFPFRVSAILGVGLPVGAIGMWFVLAIIAARLMKSIL